MLRHRALPLKHHHRFYLGRSRRILNHFVIVSDRVQFLAVMPSQEEYGIANQVLYQVRVVGSYGDTEFIVGRELRSNGGGKGTSLWGEE